MEGLAPSSRGGELKEGVSFVMMPTRNFLNTKSDDYLLSLIHETVARKVAGNFRKHLEEFFGKYVYEIEEGFAQFFSGKIAEGILEREVNYQTRESLESRAHQIFKSQWDSITRRTTFDLWYRMCLIEIKNTS